MADKISFATRETVGVQMADLFARETMKHMDNQIGPKQRATRLSLKALMRTKRFRCEFYRQTAFEDMKKRTAAMSIPGSTLAEYRRWIDGLSLEDCTSNRIRYLMAIYGSLKAASGPTGKQGDAGS
jgi:hypothetical protein